MSETTVSKANTSEEREAIKKTFCKSLTDIGISTEDAYILFDLSNHAKMQAYDAMSAVASTAPPHLRTLTLGLSLDHFEQVLKATRDHTEQTCAFGILSATIGKPRPN